MAKSSTRGLGVKNTPTRDMSQWKFGVIWDHLGGSWCAALLDPPTPLALGFKPGDGWSWLAAAAGMSLVAVGLGFDLL